MESITLYEVRVIEQNEITRQFANTLDQLVSLIKEVENKKFHAYKIYKSLEGNILSSEKLDCKIQRNNFIIKTVKTKPVNVRDSQRIRKSIAISTFQIIGSETPSPKILSHILRKPHTLHTAPRHSRRINQGSFGRNRGKRGARPQLRSRGRSILRGLSSRKPLSRNRAAGLSLRKFRARSRTSGSGVTPRRMKTNKNLRSKISRSAPTTGRANSRKNKSDSPYRRK